MNATPKANPAARVFGGSHHPTTDHGFALSVANEVFQSAPEIRGLRMTVQGYTPPNEEGSCYGSFVLDFLGDRHVAAIGIYFPADGGQTPLRHSFDYDEWREFPMDPGGSGIVAAGWDEAWLIICSLGQLLNPASVEIGYGA